MTSIIININIMTMMMMIVIAMLMLMSASRGSKVRFARVSVQADRAAQASLQKKGSIQ